MVASADLEKRVFARIDELRDEQVKVALDLSNIDRDKMIKVDELGNEYRERHISDHERIGAEYVRSWLQDNGFEARFQGLPSRPNVLAIHRGTGRGRSVLFNSHLDVGTREGLEWKLREPDAAHRIGAWQEGGDLVGQGIVNCKGPMSCWLIAAKALKDSGVELPGDIVLSAVVGETGGAPVDEFQSPRWDSHELGARYAASHGAIADYVVVAEATGFGIVPVMTGFAYFKVTILAGPSTYTAFMKRHEEPLEASHNAVLRMAKFAERFETYATQYAIDNTRLYDGVTMVPNGHIGAIRGGIPAWPVTSTEICSVYCDFRTVPGFDPMKIQRSLEGILADMGTDGVVEMYKFLPGQEGPPNKGFDTLKSSVEGAYTRMFNEAPPKVASQFVSMWRDLNPYNEIGIPALSFGFHTGYTHVGATRATSSPVSARVKIEDMVASAKLYASIAMDLCSRSTSDPL